MIIFKRHHQFLPSFIVKVYVSKTMAFADVRRTRNASLQADVLPLGQPHLPRHQFL